MADKRKAFIGLSYPLWYDYAETRHLKGQKDQQYPNPVIESPIGLLILYDELWFLSRALCPINMRNLPYVCFVDEKYPEFDFDRLVEIAEQEYSNISFTRTYDLSQVRSLLVNGGQRLDSHSRSLLLGKTTVFPTTNERSILVDYYVVEALRNTYGEDLEFITNSLTTNLESNNGTATSEFVNQLIIRDIPNYLTNLGPYHECFEELRESDYLRDFRRWVIDEHTHIQKAEIDDMCDSINRTISEFEDTQVLRLFQKGKPASLFKSIARTVFVTGIGFVKTGNALVDTSITGVTLADSGLSIIDSVKTGLSMKKDRWQGFVIESRQVVKRM